MVTTPDYAHPGPAQDAIAALRGAALLEFGTAWCGHCQAAQPLVAAALAAHPGLPHIRVEDGKGRPLGRTFHVKLWPTLVFLHDGREVARLVRPASAADVAAALARIAPPAAPVSATRLPDRAP
ncbi:thioredoxin family protein [Ramlibacter sp. H39-3-26]|uniref:thioredoxin family protein n=1 Tax=Curvibacter soli TaxID=3031331 RepID=UPI0023D9C447|nr:thioredoxin family protein [Ramlibacter sp. H39-3-26]MDF1484798.1 thioredoxin family protein [Ramlibacter sp. H39-3-26]